MSIEDRVYTPPPPPVIPPRDLTLQNTELDQLKNNLANNPTLNPILANQAQNYSATGLAFRNPLASTTNTTNPITKLDSKALMDTLGKQFPDSDWRNFNKHDGFKVGDNIVLNTADGYYKKVDANKPWEKLDPKNDKSILDQIEGVTKPKSNSSTAAQARNPEQEKAATNTSAEQKAVEEKKVTEEKKVEEKKVAEEQKTTEQKKSLFSEFTQDPTLNGLKNVGNALERLTGLPTGGSLTSLIPANQPINTFLEKSLENYHLDKIYNSYKQGISKGVEHERSLAAQVEERAGTNPSPKEIETIKYLKADAAAWEKEAKTPLKDWEVAKTSTGTYPKIAMGYRDHFTAKNIELFKEAINTGNINGHQIDKNEAEEFHEYAILYDNIIKGTYNLTPNGEVSEATHSLAMSLPDKDTLEAQLRQYGLR